MAELTTWADVAAELEKLGRGARNRLSQALEMDSGDLSRRLQGGRDLTVAQAKLIGDFLQSAPGEKVNAATSETVARLAENQVIPLHVAGRRVPVFGYAAASGGEMIAFNPGEIIEEVELPMGINPRGEVFIIRALGSSMEPRIFSGESLVVQKGLPPVRDRDAVIEFNDGSAVVKTYKGERDGQVFAWQYNPALEQRYDSSKVRAIHAIICRL